MKFNYGKNLFLAILFCLVVTLGLCAAAKQMIKVDEQREQEKEVLKRVEDDSKNPTIADQQIISTPKPEEEKPKEEETKTDSKPSDLPNTPEPTEVSAPSEKGKIVAIDPGHQAKGNSEKEPIGPGSTEMKAKVASGTTGVSTKVAEYVLTLDVSLALRDELEARGYTVLMIRETHDVDLSNRERAELANESADIFIRIHANGSDNEDVSGALSIYPSESNQFVGTISKECKKLAEAVIEEFCNATGAKNRGAIVMDNMSGINWCTIPVTILEMGFMSNPEEDQKMQESEYQKKMVQGIANGVDAYFATEE